MLGAVVDLDLLADALGTDDVRSAGRWRPLDDFLVAEDGRSAAVPACDSPTGRVRGTSVPAPARHAPRRRARRSAVVPNDPTPSAGSSRRTTSAPAPTPKVGSSRGWPATKRGASTPTSRRPSSTVARSSAHGPSTRSRARSSPRSQPHAVKRSTSPASTRRRAARSRSPRKRVALRHRPVRRAVAQGRAHPRVRGAVHGRAAHLRPGAQAPRSVRRTAADAGVAHRGVRHGAVPAGPPAATRSGGPSARSQSPSRRRTCGRSRMRASSSSSASRSSAIPGGWSSGAGPCRSTSSSTTRSGSPTSSTTSVRSSFWEGRCAGRARLLRASPARVRTCRRRRGRGDLRRTTSARVLLVQGRAGRRPRAADEGAPRAPVGRVLDGRGHRPRQPRTCGGAARATPTQESRSSTRASASSRTSTPRRLAHEMRVRKVEALLVGGRDAEALELVDELQRLPAGTIEERFVRGARPDARMAVVAQRRSRRRGGRDRPHPPARRAARHLAGGCAGAAGPSRDRAAGEACRTPTPTMSGQRRCLCKQASTPRLRSKSGADAAIA